MKKIFLLAFVIFSAASSVKAQTTPIQFNDTLVNIVDSLYAKGQKWGMTFGEAYKTGTYSTLTPIADDMLSFVDASITRVTNMKDIKNSKALRLATLDLLNFEKSMVGLTFRPFESFTATTPKDKVADTYNNLQAKSLEEQAFIKKMQAAQQIYATENGFKIEQ